MNKIKLDPSFVKELAANSKSIGSFVGSLIALNGLSRTEFTNLSGLSLSYTSQLLCDRVPWNDDLINKVADVLCVDSSLFPSYDKATTTSDGSYDIADVKYLASKLSGKPAVTNSKEKKVEEDIDLMDFTTVPFVGKGGFNAFAENVFSVNVNSGRIVLASSFDLEGYPYVSLLENKANKTLAFAFTKKKSNSCFHITTGKGGSKTISCKAIARYIQQDFSSENKFKCTMGKNIAKNTEAIIRVITGVA